MLEKIEGRRRRGNDRGWAGGMASPTRWTWVWASSRSWWWTGKLGMLQSMGLQRVGHGWATDEPSHGSKRSNPDHKIISTKKLIHSKQGKCLPPRKVKKNSRIQNLRQKVMNIISGTFMQKANSVQSSRLVVSYSLRPHGLQHTRPPCPSPTLGAFPNSCPSSQWCHPTISSCCPLLLLPLVFPSIRVFSSESVLHIRCPKYWSFSFSISPPNEHSELISFRMDWLDLLAVQGTQVFSNTTV